MKIYKNHKNETVVFVNCANCQNEINAKNNYCGYCGSQNFDNLENISEAIQSVDLEYLSLSSRLEIYNLDSEYFTQYFKDLKINLHEALTKKILVRIR